MPLFPKVEKFMKERGLDFAPKPKSTKYSEMPEDVTKLTPRRLGRHYNALVAWYGYAASELSKINIDVIDLEHDMRKLKARLDLVYASKFPQKYKRDKAIQRNKKFQALETKLIMAQAKRTALEMTVDRYDRMSAALSREMSRRGMEFDKSGRM